MAPIDARKKIEQIRRNKKSQPPNVKDLRQLIGRKRRQNKSDPSPIRNGRITKANSSLGPRDLRETNKKLAARKNIAQSRDSRVSSRRSDRISHSVNTVGISSDRKFIKNVVNGQVKPTKFTRPQQLLYVPPHLHNQPATYIIAPAATKSNLAMDNVPEAQGASILISNLMPSITQSDIIELFGDVGVMTAVNMINQTTALVTYQNSSDAVRAVKVYHNRLLDGKPMLVNMMPNSTPSSNVRSRIQ